MDLYTYEFTIGGPLCGCVQPMFSHDRASVWVCVPVCTLGSSVWLAVCTYVFTLGGQCVCVFIYVFTLGVQCVDLCTYLFTLGGQCMGV